MGDKVENSTADFFEVVDDEDSTVRWSHQEIQEYILSKIGTFIEDPDMNPLISVNRDIGNVLKDVEHLYERFQSLQRTNQNMQREHQLFLSHIGALESTIEYRSVGVQVDLPFLHEIPQSLAPVELPEVIPSSSKSSNSLKMMLPTKPPKGKVECIDLTEDEQPPISTKQVLPNSPASTVSASSSKQVSPSSTVNHIRQPPPLPSVLLRDQNIPPKPVLKISVVEKGINVQWDMPPEAQNMKISNFEIYAYQEKNSVPASSSLWERIGFVHAMPLPMSCTLTQFMPGCKYHFSIRAVTSSNKLGYFSDPVSIIFTNGKKK